MTHATSSPCNRSQPDPEPAFMRDVRFSIWCYGSFVRESFDDCCIKPSHMAVRRPPPPYLFSLPLPHERTDLCTSRCWISFEPWPVYESVDVDSLHDYDGDQFLGFEDRDSVHEYDTQSDEELPPLEEDPVSPLSDWDDADYIRLQAGEDYSMVLSELFFLINVLRRFQPSSLGCYESYCYVVEEMQAYWRTRNLMTRGLPTLNFLGHAFRLDDAVRSPSVPVIFEPDPYFRSRSNWGDDSTPTPFMDRLDRDGFTGYYWPPSQENMVFELDIIDPADWNIPQEIQVDNNDHSYEYTPQSRTPWTPDYHQQSVPMIWEFPVPDFSEPPQHRRDNFEEDYPSILAWADHHIEGQHTRWRVAMQLMHDVELNPGPVMCYFIGLAALYGLDRFSFEPFAVHNIYSTDFPFFSTYETMSYDPVSFESNAFFLSWFWWWLVSPSFIFVACYMLDRFLILLRYFFGFTRFAHFWIVVVNRHVLWRFQMLQGFGPYSLLLGFYIWYVLWGVLGYLNPIHSLWISFVCYCIAFVWMRVIAHAIGYLGNFFARRGRSRSWQTFYYAIRPFYDGMEDFLELPAWLKEFECALDMGELDEKMFDDMCEMRYDESLVDNGELVHQSQFVPQMDSSTFSGDAEGCLHPEWAAFEHTQDRARMLKIRKKLLKVVRKHDTSSVSKCLLRACVASLNEYFALHPKEEARFVSQMNGSWFSTAKDFLAPRVGMDSATQATLLKFVEDLRQPKVTVDIPLLTSLRDQLVSCYEKPELHQLGLYLAYLA